MMKIHVIERDGLTAAVVRSDEVLIKDTQSALDFMMTVKYETGCTDIALNKEGIAEEFFVLSTCLAGEILQKFINYGVRFAVYGDFSHYTSKPLRDFMYESNKGRDVFFAAGEEEAVTMLLQRKS